MSRWVELHHALWTGTRVQIAALEEMLEQQQAAFAEPLERLRGVPGVGPIVAFTAIATFSDVDRFASAEHAASYAGLIPSTYQSGDRDAHGGITRRGAVELRTVLCEAAHQARRADHPLHPYFRSVCARRGYKLAVVAVAHRLCRILWAMLRHRTRFDVRKLGVEQGPFEKTTTRLYRLKKSTRVAAATA